MSRLIVDIETLAYPFETFDAPQQEYLLKFAATDEEREECLRRLSLYPATARVIAIGLLNADTGRGKVLFQSGIDGNSCSEDGCIEFIPANEPRMLAEFWDDISRCSQFITFNGRQFDCPFLMLRSAILRIPASRNLLPYRYDPGIHCDLLEQFTFYGAMRKFNLDFYCKAFGIDSPKSRGITGHDLGRLFEEQRFRDIAVYCSGDLIATSELFNCWEENLDMNRKERREE